MGIAPTAAAQDITPVTIDAQPEFSQQPEPNLQAAAEVPPAALSNDLAVLATQVDVTGASPELTQIAYNTLSTQAGRPTSNEQIEADVAALRATQLFREVQVAAVPNDQGWDVQYNLTPVVIDRVQLVDAEVLSTATAQNLFADQMGQAVQPSAINQGIAQVNQWYQDEGYAIAKVKDVQARPDGSLLVNVQEGIVAEVDVAFIDEEGQLTDGRTQPDFVHRYLGIQPGDVFTVAQVQEDLAQLYQLGLFEQAHVALRDNGDRVNVTYELREASARGVNVGGGYSKASGVFGTLSYNDRNFGGIGQNLNANLQLGTKDIQFETRFGSPYRVSQPDTLGYELHAFRQRGISSSFDDEVRLENGDRPREGRFGGGVEVQGAIDDWQTAVGVNYRRVSVRDSDGSLASVDQYGNALSTSETGIDDLYTIRAQVTNDQRDNLRNPTSGSVFSLSSEQSIPVGSGDIAMNQLNASYSTYQATSLFSNDNPEVIAFNLQGGTTIGDLPAHQLFLVGGANSVRGYGTGDLAASRSYVLASAEYRVPLFSSPLTGVLFADFASDMGSSPLWLGEDGEADESKPGSGFGYGAGIRVDSPLGVIRADFGISNQGDSRLQFGIGHRF
ncbi:MAG: BamA/TamA family outer membrane protein [Spirulina sp. SIO3F2]|nr:BamA/TamA family outer membrane protein [Spirulina sp. SIO3F2]